MGSLEWRDRYLANSDGIIERSSPEGVEVEAIKEGSLTSCPSASGTTSQTANISPSDEANLNVLVA